MNWSRVVILMFGGAAGGCWAASGGGAVDAAADSRAKEARAELCEASCDGRQSGDGGCGCLCGQCNGPQDICVDVMCQCQPACEHRECGDDGCGGICGDCGPSCNCVDGMCDCGAPDCEGKECGPDGLGGLCGVCVDDQLCHDGKCVGPGTDCPMLGSGSCQRAMLLKASLEANAGGGLDLDDNPETCAPAGDCSDGVDNGFAAVMPAILSLLPESPVFFEAFYGHGTFLQFSSSEWELDGKSFDLAGTVGRPDASSGECVWVTGQCFSCVPQDGADFWSCETPMSFDNAKVLDGILTAGGPDSLALLQAPVLPGVVLPVSVWYASIQAKAVPLDGGGFRLEQGLLAGAVRKDTLMEAVDYMPEPLLSGAEKDALKEAIDTLAVADIDSDEDGEKEAISMAFHFTTLPGTSVGLCPE